MNKVNYFIILIIYINNIINSYIINQNHNIYLRKYKLNSDNYLNIKPNLRDIKLNEKKITEKICNICSLNINTKKMIPYNCTIPEGCPFNIQTLKKEEDNKYIFKG